MTRRTVRLRDVLSTAEVRAFERVYTHFAQFLLNSPAKVALTLMKPRVRRGLLEDMLRAERSDLTRDALLSPLPAKHRLYGRDVTGLEFEQVYGKGDVSRIETSQHLFIRRIRQLL